MVYYVMNKIKGGFLMKKFISAIIAATMSVSIMAAVSADNNPTVYVDNAEVVFPDQKAEIVDDRTLVPVRGIFEMIGASVKWDGDTRTVQIDSADNKTRVYIAIDDEIMKLYKFKDIFSSDETLIVLDVAPQILNDRTMVPLRAISEALGTEVIWDPEAYAVYITTEPSQTADASNETETGNTSPAAAPLVIEKPAISLTSSADAVSEGDLFDVYINLSGMPKDSYVNTVTALLKYDKENFEYQDFTLFANGEDVSMVLGGDSSGYDSYNEGIKITAIVSGDGINQDGTVAKLTFKSITGEGGEIALVNSYEPIRGYNTTITLKQGDKTIELAGRDAVIDTTPLIISEK